LPLTKIHHTAFNAHLIGVDPNFRVHVSDPLLDVISVTERDLLGRLERDPDRLSIAQQLGSQATGPRDKQRPSRYRYDDQSFHPFQPQPGLARPLIDLDPWCAS
jgi:hypothetical protein